MEAKIKTNLSEVEMKALLTIILFIFLSYAAYSQFKNPDWNTLSILVTPWIEQNSSDENFELETVTTYNFRVLVKIPFTKYITAAPFYERRQLRYEIPTSQLKIYKQSINKFGLTFSYNFQ